jgi:hypothetical protein
VYLESTRIWQWQYIISPIALAGNSVYHTKIKLQLELLVVHY